jgi:hypothetical protein
MLWVLFLALMISPAKPPDDDPPEEDATVQLAKVRRVYVDILTGGEAALQFRDILMTSLQRSKVFAITEEEDKADAMIKGAADDHVFTENFTSSDGVNAHTQIGGGSSGTSRNTNSRYAGLSIGENESHHSEERKHEAIATVRLVSKDGDVLWSATAESFGGKFLGASADVADKLAKRLAIEVKEARRTAVAAPAARPETPAPSTTAAH